MKFSLCKVEYVGKAETAFNIKLNNHRKDVSNPKSHFVTFFITKTFSLELWLFRSLRK